MGEEDKNVDCYYRANMFLYLDNITLKSGSKIGMNEEPTYREQAFIMFPSLVVMLWGF